MRRLFSVLILVLISSVVVPASAQGGVLTYGTSSVGNVSAAQPLAIYTFQAQENDQIMLRVIALAPDQNLTLTMQGQSVFETSESDFSVPGSGDARIDFRIPAAGLYTVIVSDASGTPGDFLIQLTGSPAPTDVVTGSPATVDIAAASDSYFYAFDASPDAPTQVEIESQTDDFSFVALLRNPAGQTAGIASGTSASMTVPAGDGTYEIELRSASDATGAVLITLNLIEDEDEPQDIPEPAATEETDEIDESNISDGEGQCFVFTNADVPVRAAPDQNADIIGTLRAGQIAIATGRSGPFFVIDLPSISGYVFVAQVNTQGGCRGLPQQNGDSSDTAPEPTPTNTVTTEPDDSQEPVTTEEPDDTNGAVQATPTSTSTLTPTATASATTAGAQPPQSTPTPTSTRTPTATATTVQPTATFTPSYTPTTQATATYTPSYTPTTPPAAQVAPEDPRFNSPLNIPLDGTVSVVDFVSYPGGDTEDRVRWDIIGMNPNSALSGGRARLVIAVSCFGTGTANIEFFTGGQTYSCGQTIVDQEVTYNSRTGSVVITAVGGTGTYVQWVLTGTATRVN